MERSRIVRVPVDYRPRRQFVAFHRRWQRFACIVTHRRAGKTVACIHDLHRGATRS
jgi:phage terminase large subunit